MNAFTQKLQAMRQQERLQLLFDAISKGIVHVEQLVIVTYGAWLVMHGQSTIGVIYAFIQYKNLFADKFIDSIQLYVRRKVLQVHMDRVADVLQTETEARPTRSCGRSTISTARWRSARCRTRRRAATARSCATSRSTCRRAARSRSSAAPAAAKRRC